MSTTRLILVIVFAVPMVACQQKVNLPIAIDPFQTPGRKVRLAQENKTLTASVLIDEGCLLQMRAAGLSSPLLTAIPSRNIHLSSRKSSIQSHRIYLPEQISSQRLEEMAKADPCIIGIADHRQARVNSYGSDPLFAQQSHLKNICSLEANRFFSQTSKKLKKDVVIAFIDSGIDLQHPDLANQLWVNQKELSGQADIDDDQNGFVDDVYGYNFASSIGDPSHQTVNDHGTHLSGLAAAANNNLGGTGVTDQKIKIMSLNVFGRNWETENVLIDQAIRYATDNGANIINISIGGYGPSETTASAIAYAINRGCIITVAAGNASIDIENKFYFPASYARQFTGLISVAATDAVSNELCSFTNYSSKLIKMAAPGCDSKNIKAGLLSTRSNGKYGYKSGTSQSSAIVAGSAALIYGLLRDNSNDIVHPADVERILMTGSEHLEGLISHISGGNKLNLENIFQINFE